MNKDQPIFISFYTNNGKYPKKAKVLEKSLKDFNLRYELVPLNKNFNSWLDTVRYKATFIFDSLLKYRSSVVWLDIDNEIWQFPSLLFKDNDFAIYNWYADKDHHLDGKIYCKEDERIRNAVRVVTVENGPRELIKSFKRSNACEKIFFNNVNLLHICLRFQTHCSIIY